MPIHKDHLLKHFAALKGSKHVLEERTEGLRLDGIEYLTHRGITGHPHDAKDLLQIARGALLIKGQQRG